MRTAVLLSSVAALGSRPGYQCRPGRRLNSSEVAFAPSADNEVASDLGEEAAGYDIFEPEALDGAVETAADESAGRLHGCSTRVARPGRRQGAGRRRRRQHVPARRDADKILYGPLATGAGTIRAMGYLIVIDGIEAVRLDEKCDFNGKSWPCGQRARTEFRAWMRDRALTCRVPPAPAARAVLTSCRIGNQDAGDWLVKYGWARALSAGPYVAAGEKARTEKLGIFGAPSALDGAETPAQDGPQPS